MNNRRPYIAESAIKPGTPVVQGSADNKVKAPSSKGEGDFIGLYPFEANEAKKAGEEIGIVVHGIAKALAAKNVRAGKYAILFDDSRGLVEAPDKGTFSTVGIFLESGSDGEYVDILIQRGSVTVA